MNDLVRPAVLTRRGAPAIAIAGAVFAITGAALFRGPLLPDIGRTLQASAADLGGLVAAFGAGRLLANVPAGRLSDRSPPTRMLLAAGAIVAGGSWLFAVSPTLWVAVLASGILGAGSAWTNTTGLAYFSTRGPRQRRGRSLSLFAVAFLGGQALGPGVGGLVGASVGWRAALAVGGALALMASVVAVLPGSRRQPSVGRPPRVLAPGDESAVEPAPRLVMAVVYCLPLVQFTIGGAMIQTLVPLLGSAEHLLDVATIGLALSIGGLVRIVGALAAGWIADRHGRRRALLPGLVLQTLGVTLLAVDHEGAWWAGIVALSLGAVSVSVGAAMLADLVPAAQVGRRLGVFRLVGDVGMLAGPLASAALYQAFGPAAAVLPVLALAVAVGVAAAVVLPETLVPVP